GAFPFAAIVGSASLWGAHPDAMQGALARHDAILRACVEEHSGSVFSTSGDGMAAAFARTADALVAAVEAQRAFERELWPEDTPIRVRMGLHTGEAQERDGDYFGRPLNRAARLMGAARGGQVLLSGTTAALLAPPPPSI